jgi:hypothetical protein
VENYLISALQNAADFMEGQIAGISSTQFGLSNMIWAAVTIGKVSSRSSTFSLPSLNAE